LSTELSALAADLVSLGMQFSIFLRERQIDPAHLENDTSISDALLATELKDV
jgi:hypothetical protein